MAQPSRDTIFYLYNGIPDHYQQGVPEGFSVEYNNWKKEHHSLRPYITPDALVPNTFAELTRRYPEYLDIALTKPSANTRSNTDRNMLPGGSRRSLQKSRLVKRKSRKYKSIKKSKKRSFRKRSGKY